MYPDINDLIHAADAAILDYSSLRFDWHLTQKPAIYFVPDIDLAFKTRPPLLRYEDTAPGRWAETTADVAAALSDLPAIRAEYQGQVDVFNARFNQSNDGKSSQRVIQEFFHELL